jgi:hypothetical protein
LKEVNLLNFFSPFLIQDEDSEESDTAPKKVTPKKRQQESGSEYEEFDEENSESSVSLRGKSNMN